VTLADDGDWTDAYTRHADDVYRLARMILRDAEDAGEVVQSTFEQAFRNRARYDSSRPLKPWLLGIASHEALHLARRRRLRSWVPLLGSETAAQAAENDSAVWQAVNALPAGHRACVGLFYLYGFSIDEIAGLLKIASGTVASRLHSARKRLRELLGDIREEVHA
jgi:RNA polymerase sigma-70 factor (ECF subfamily)